MSHVEHDTLWSLARGELSSAESAEAKTHLLQCPDCRVSYEDVQLATQVLRDLPEVPPMPEMMARRVGAELAEAADAQAARRFTSWWQSLFTPRFVFAAALGVLLVAVGAYVLAGVTEPVPAPIALPTPAPAPTLPELPQKKLQVTVASASKSSTRAAQVLSEGSRVSTQTGGSVWMKLPDGSRAGLTSATDVKLTTLEPKTLALELEKGSLAMVVPHREDRLLVVRAGELTVKDLGTRFLVSRETNRTLVAVEEGEVEVSTPTGARVVKAGRAVSWSDAKLTELPWEATPPAPPVRASKPVEPSTPDIPTQVAPVPEAHPESVARLDEEDDAADDSPPPEEFAAPDQEPMVADEQWHQPPPAVQQPNHPPPPTALKPAVTSSERGFSLRKLERKLRELGVNISTPDRREAGARNIALTADAGDCKYALRLIDAWLAQPAVTTPKEVQLRGAVLRQQVRCLNHVGRVDEARQLEQSITAQ
jgi:hypothetical protein